MNTKHTPGPWKVGNGSVGSKAVFAGNQVIAPAPNEIRTHKEAEANAHLIAAAPELLEASKAVVEDWKDSLRDGVSYPRSGFDIERLQALDSAIAKAEGHS